MKYTLSIREDQIEQLNKTIDRRDNKESGGYIFCNVSQTKNEVRLIVKEIQGFEAEYVIARSANNIRIASDSFTRAMAKAAREDMSLIFVHSHPNGSDEYSELDDKEELDFFRTAYLRAPKGFHASVIYVGKQPDKLIGRVWLNDGTNKPLSRIRVVGKRLKFFDNKEKHSIPQWTHRQVLAFGPDLQKQLKVLHVGVVGAGGTGSAVNEQLIRLGVERITIIDDQDFEDTNVNRLYGSRMTDADSPTPKVDIIERLANNIHVGTKITKIKDSICDPTVIKKLRDCDLVFGCTDDFLGRMMLNRLVFWYYIPVIDSAVLINSDEGEIKEVIGRVTNLFPGSACLSCRKRISDRRIIAQSKQREAPEEYQELVKEGYIPELGIPDPSVIMFTAGIASRAVSEFINMLTGYMGKDRTATEMVERFHIPELRRNSVSGQAGCLCTTSAKWGNGDQEHFLGII